MPPQKTDPADVTEARPMEVVGSEPQALAPLRPAQLQPYADAPPVAGLAMLENGLQVAQRMAQIVEGVRTASIGMTSPPDWILNKDAGGVETAMLGASGAQKIASLYGISLMPIEGGTLEPQEADLDGKRGYTLRCVAYSKLLGRELEIEASRREDEKFTGRATNGEGDFSYDKDATSYGPDLKKAVRTLALSTAVRELVGLKGVGRSELDAVWKGGTKTSDHCRMGHGYGTSTDRSASGVAEGDVAATAEALRIELLKRVNGDEKLAKTVLSEITVDKDGKYAKTSTKQFTQAWQVEAAMKRLRAHATFGDQAQRQREPGAD